MGFTVMPKVLELLPKTRDRAIDAAIVDALPHLDQETAAATLDLLVQRNHEPSAKKLVATFCEMSDPLRSLVVERATGLHEAIRAAIGSPDLDHRQAAIALVVAAKDVASSHLLSDTLREKCPHTRELAAEGLLELTRYYLGLTEKESIESVGYAQAYRAHLSAALSDAILGWDVHYQRPVLEAAFYLGDAVEPAIVKKLDDANSRIGHMATEVLEGTTDTRLAGFVLRALAIEPLRRSTVARITRTTNAPFIDAVLRQTWLLADTAITQGCRWLKDGDWSRNWCHAVSDRSSTLPATAIDFIAQLGGTPEQRMQRFAMLLESSNDQVRRNALWRLISDESDEATALLLNFARRTNEPLADLAERECRHRRPASGAQESPPTETTSAPTATATPATTHGQVIERYLTEFDRLSADERNSLGAKLVRLVGNLPERLNKYARSSVASTRGRTVRVAVELGLVGEMADSIYELAHDPDGSVRAVAVSALRELPGATTTRILRDALNDPDPRVQANAIETLEALGLTGGHEAVSPKLSSPNNRVRANTVKALLGMQFEPAADALLDMLGDVSQAHRISALWVIERMRLRSMLDRIAEMSQTDSDSRVRDRASRVMRDLSISVPRQPIGVISSENVLGVSR